MDSKEYLTNKSFCPLPWTGFLIEADGNIKNCICSFDSIGNIKEKSIIDIVKDIPNTQIKSSMLANQKPSNCEYCYNLETNKKSTNIVSSRIYYLKELKKVPHTTYQMDTFSLKHVDLRWQNLCNFACVYCGPIYSSTWEKEINYQIDRPTKEQIKQIKDYVFENIHQLENIYLAGGEPLLMKENEEFLSLLLEKNPNVTLRVNTNLSKTGTKVFDLLQQFTNVHWTVSIESLDKEFEYMRYGGVWKEFLENLDVITKLNHKLTFNMVWCLFNFKSIFECIEFLQSKGFHNNSFVITALYGPAWFDSRNLPDHILQDVKRMAQEKIDEHPGFLLEDGYKNIIKHIDTPFDKNIDTAFAHIKELDKRRSIDSKNIFTDLHAIYQEYMVRK